MGGNYYEFREAIIAYGKDGTDVRLSIPIHKNQSLKPGLQNRLTKKARITDKHL